ncbi:MAG TPA: hypothetical protein VFD60_12580 [Nitrososphaeraceae archaeon]|nr:hypothetical protein [Nitrososphaeraceae archaeon]
MQITTAKDNSLWIDGDDRISLVSKVIVFDSIVILTIGIFGAYSMDHIW